ncbi:Putative polyol transporter 1 [Linum perenne]
MLLVAFGNIVAAVSSLVAGASANYYGEKKPFAAMGGMFILGSLFKGFGTSSYIVLLIDHLLTSFGIGFSFTIAPTYIVEPVPAPSRGFFISTIQGRCCTIWSPYRLPSHHA